MPKQFLSGALTKGKQVIDVTQISIKIDKQEKNIERLYANLGRAFFKTRSNPTEPMYDELFRAIAGAEAHLNYLHMEMDAAKGMSRCVSCASELYPTDAYCPKCGKTV